MQHHPEIAAIPAPPAYLDLVGELPLLDLDFDALDDIVSPLVLLDIRVEH